MLKEKRGAIELSITTIVVVVIGITLLTLGLRWITTTMDDIGQKTEKLQKITDSQIAEIFEDSEKSISTIQKNYNIKKGQTLTNLEIYIRNNVAPGATYNFVYTITPLDHPPSVQPSEIVSQMSYITGPIEIESGRAMGDTVLFDTRNLPVGIYKFEASLICQEGCSPPDSRHQFLVTIQ